MSQKPASEQPTKRQKVDKDYEPRAEESSGSSDLEVYSDELNDDQPEIDINEYLRQRQRIIEEEEEEEESEFDESQEEDEEESSEEEPPPRSRGKRKRASPSSSSE